MADEFLYPADGGVLRIAFRQGGEFAVHVAMQTARPPDDAGEIEIGNDPDGPLLDFIAGAHQCGRGKAARLVALYAAHNQHGAIALTEADGNEVQRGGGRFPGSDIRCEAWAEAQSKTAQQPDPEQGGAERRHHEDLTGGVPRKATFRNPAPGAARRGHGDPFRRAGDRPEASARRWTDRSSGWIPHPADNTRPSPCSGSARSRW